jgi:hypothetical protein
VLLKAVRFSKARLGAAKSGEHAKAFHLPRFLRLNSKR